MDTADSGDFFDGGRSEAVLNQGGNQGGVLEPEAEAVGEDIELGGGIEGAVFRGDGRGRGAEWLVYLLLCG